MFRRTDFGGFLVCCKIGHPYLNDVENKSVAISLMLSLENAQIDWTNFWEVEEVGVLVFAFVVASVFVLMLVLC